MMRKDNKVYCDNCGKELGSEFKSDKYTHFGSIDLDTHGIWLSEKQKWIWFERDNAFCNFACALEWLQKQSGIPTWKMS